MASAGSGFVRGFGFGRQLQDQRRSNETREAQAQAEARQQRLEQVNSTLEQLSTTAAQVVENADASGIARSDPRVQKAIGALQQQAVGLAAAAAQMPGATVSPDVVQTQFEALLMQPTPETERANAEATARATARGKAQGEADVAGNKRSVVVGPNSRLNQQFQLGIPQGEQARVEVTMDDNGTPTGATVVSGFGSGDTNIHLGDAFSESQLEARNQFISEGRQAVFTSRNLQQMADLIADPATQTGSLQPMITSLQGLAQDAGVDLEGIASSLGIQMGSLESKQEFDRIAKQVIIDGFEKFKGNLNNREVQLAMDAFQNLGRSEQANIDAIAAGMAAQEMARKRALDAIDATTDSEIRALQREMLREDTGEFQRLKDRFASEIRERRAEATQSDTARPTGTELAIPEGIPDGSQFIGESEGGGDVYRTPDGRFLIYTENTNANP